jgi:hypothetical protein
MTHSNRVGLHLVLVFFEVLLFIAAIVSAYLSQVNAWSGFIIVSVIATVIFSVLKIIDAMPTLRTLLIREDMASRMALSAERYGVKDYFNMQSARDQTLRNERTQHEIKRARGLWLCANSGASFLDPGVYRHWQFIEQRLNEGVEFRVVLLDPFSQEKAFRNQINVSGEHFDSKVNIGNLIKLHNAFPSLEIRFAKNGMHATVFATENCVFFDPYQVGVVGDRIENRSFSLRIEHAEPSEGIGLYRLFKSHFDTLWRSSVVFSEWIEVSQEKLPPGLPTLKAR